MNAVSAIMVAIRGLHGNFEAEADRQDAPLAADVDAEGSLPVLMGVFRVIDAHFSHRFSVPIENCTDQAGTGGARSRAILASICPNIRAETATSAIWKVT